MQAFLEQKYKSDQDATINLEFTLFSEAEMG